LKKVVIITIAFLFVQQGFAQPKAGDFLLGGNLSFGRQRGLVPDNASAGTTTQTTLKFKPNVGVFFSKRVLVGFNTNVDYYSSANRYIVKDSVGKEYSVKSQFFELTFGFGAYTTYYYPVCNNLYWVNTLNIGWGSYTRGDKVASLFAEDKPKQDRVKFVEARLSTGLQYFVRHNIAVDVSIEPLTLTYNYKKVVRDNTPVSSQNTTALRFSNIAKGFSIGIRFLIISDNEESK
jgi:hypothetical protein